MKDLYTSNFINFLSLGGFWVSVSVVVCCGGALQQMPYVVKFKVWFSSLFGGGYYSKWSVFSLVLILYFSFLNLLTLIHPHMPAYSSGVHFILLLSGGFWFVVVLSSSLESIGLFVSLMVPGSGSSVLGVYLFLIEVLSKFSRPFVLALRISVIMTSAKLVMVMVGGCFVGSVVGLTSSGSGLVSFLMFLLVMILYCYDFAVCFIQGYIFMKLVSNYSSE